MFKKKKKKIKSYHIINLQDATDRLSGQCQCTDGDQ